MAHFVACSCASYTFLMNVTNFKKSTEVVRIARFGEHANLFPPNDCMEFVGWMDEVGSAINNEMNAKMKGIKNLRFAKYHVLHPKKEVPASKSMTVQALQAWYNLMSDVSHNSLLCLTNTGYMRCPGLEACHEDAGNRTY